MSKKYKRWLDHLAGYRITLRVKKVPTIRGQIYMLGLLVGILRAIEGAYIQSWPLGIVSTTLAVISGALLYWLDRQNSWVDVPEDEEKHRYR